MPQNITIAAFVLGAVLLLISLLGGSFKIFAAEISGKVGKFGRIISFVLSIIFISIGLIGSFDQPSSQPSSGSAQSGAPVPSQQAAGAQDSSLDKGSTKAPLQQANISGDWHAENGTLLSIAQHGNEIAFEFETKNESTEETSQGNGSIKDNQIEVQYQMVKQSSEGPISSTGTGNLTLSDDGKQMRGKFSDSVWGSFSLIYSR